MARTKHMASRSRSRNPTNATVPPLPSSPAAAAPSPRRGRGDNDTQARTPPTSPASGRKKKKKGANKKTKPPPSSTTKKKPHRFKSGTVALREIRRFQKTTDHLIPKASFIREVRSITHDFASQNVTRWTAEALIALQEAAEDHLVSLFSNAMLCTIHARRVTLMRKDMELARRLGGVSRPW